MKKKRAVFLDRDGTLNRDVGYPGHWSQIHIYPFSFGAVRRLRRAGLAPVVVTNQSGVGRGAFTENDLRELHRKFSAAFEAGRARLDGIFYCPHFSSSVPAAEESACPCRKPRPDLALRAAEELSLELSGSYVVGDKTSDVLFGLHIGALPVLVLTGYGRASLRDLEARGLRPAHVAGNLREAAAWIASREKAAGRRSGLSRRPPRTRP
jgi:D-glycero-D-manno-heptose 1,7-bisphosphate phosphatase